MAKESTHVRVNSEMHARRRNNLYLPQANLTIYKKKNLLVADKNLYNLPLEMKIVAGNLKKV